MATIRELLNDLGVRFYEQGEVSVSEGWIALDCPTCGVPGKPGLGIHVRSLKANCWKCGPHWLGHILRDSTNRPLYEIMKLLADLDSYLPGEFTDRKPRGKYTPPADVGPLLPAHVRYLRSPRRGRLDPEELVRVWGIGGIGIALDLQWRIFVPVIQHEKPVSWTTRAIGDVPASFRYRSAKPHEESISIKETIFGLDFVRNTTVICEGPFDAMSIGRGAVSIYGLEWTHEQVLRLSRIPVRYICFDMEAGAQARAQQLAADLSMLPGDTNIIELSTGKDPSNCLESERQEIRKLLA